MRLLGDPDGDWRSHHIRHGFGRRSEQHRVQNAQAGRRLARPGERRDVVKTSEEAVRSEMKESRCGNRVEDFDFQLCTKQRFFAPWQGVAVIQSVDRSKST